MFAQKFKAKYGVEVGQGGDAAYDGVQMLFAAIKNANSTDPEKVKDELKKIKTWDGASGKLTFDEFGGVHKDPVFLIVKGNAIEPYTP